MCRCSTLDLGVVGLVDLLDAAKVGVVGLVTKAISEGADVEAKDNVGCPKAARS